MLLRPLQGFARGRSWTCATRHSVYPKIDRAPAKLLAVFVVDTSEKELTFPLEK